MVICLILGMGIPTIPNYIITSSVIVVAIIIIFCTIINMIPSSNTTLSNSVDNNV